MTTHYSPISQQCRTASNPFPRFFKYAVCGWWFFCVTSPLLHAQSVDLVKPIERAKKTVVPVVCLVRDVKTGTQQVKFRVFGTAFFVDEKGTFITAHHLIADFAKPPWSEVCLPAITLPIGGWKRTSQEVRWFAFDLAKCQSNQRWDVAVCKTRDDVSKVKDLVYETAQLSAERPPDGTAIFFTGFPLQATDPITSTGSIAGFSAGDVYNTLLIDKNAWPGASGSPIYLADGITVIGMLERTGTGDAAGISFAVAGERLINILASARSNWAKEENQQPED